METKQLHLDPNTTYTFDTDEAVKMLLFYLGMPAGIPRPLKDGKIQGVNMMLQSTGTHNIMAVRFANRKNKPNASYYAMALAIASYSPAEMLEIFRKAMDVMGIKPDATAEFLDRDIGNLN
jgi:hypothetical protein